MVPRPQDLEQLHEGGGGVNLYRTFTPEEAEFLRQLLYSHIVACMIGSVVGYCVAWGLIKAPGGKS